jgi:hypothetical protein
VALLAALLLLRWLLLLPKWPPVTQALGQGLAQAAATRLLELRLLPAPAALHAALSDQLQG